MDPLGEWLPQIRTEVPGPASSALAEKLAQVECPALTARRARRAEKAGAPHDPITWKGARGANVVDADGNVYVDLTGGFGVAALGHGEPAVSEAVREQAQRLMHALGDVCPSTAKVELLERLAQLAPWPARVILGLSGADAVEAALKTAVLHTGRPGVVAFTGGYHGLSHGPLAACGYGEGFRAPFASQLNPHVVFAPYPNADTSCDAALAAAEVALDQLDELAGAILVEPIQGRGGVHVPPSGFLRGLGELAHARDALLIVDEIYTGLGRCGQLWLHLQDDADADLLCTGKALGGGMPISACLGKQEVMAAWGDPDGEALHTSTFLGNPLGCAGALAFLQMMDHEMLPALCETRGAKLRSELEATVRSHGGHVRGQGLLLGYAPANPEHALPLVRLLLERGYLLLPAGAPPEVLCLTPPASITTAQVRGFITALNESLEALS